MNSMPATESLKVIFTDLSGIFGVDDGPLYSGARTVRREFFQEICRGSYNLEGSVLCSSVASKTQVERQISNVGLDSNLRAVYLDDLSVMSRSHGILLHSLNANLRISAEVRRYIGGKWPVIGMCHDLSDKSIFDDLTLAAASGFYRNDALVACSNASKSVLMSFRSHIEKLLDRDISTLAFPIIPHGSHGIPDLHFDKVDFLSSIGCPAGATMFLFFGRLSIASKADLKGLIRCFATAMRSHKAVLVLAGECSGQDDVSGLRSLRSLVYEMGASDKIIFRSTPSDDEKIRLYRSADVFVSPAVSIQESFGISVVDAMSCGLPVISSDWDGYKDIVRHNVTGRLVKTLFCGGASHVAKKAGMINRYEFLSLYSGCVEIDFSCFAADMIELNNNTSLRLMLGSNGKKRYNECFTWKSVMKQHISDWIVRCKAASEEVYHMNISSYPDLYRSFLGHSSSIV